MAMHESSTESSARPALKRQLSFEVIPNEQSIDTADEFTDSLASSKAIPPAPPQPPLKYSSQPTQFNGESIASERDLQEFHHHFPTLPQDEPLFSIFHAASRESVLYQGRIYISLNFICFRSTVLPHTPHIIRFTSITQINQKSHLKLPNSISIETDTAYYFFTHLVQRRKVLELIQRIYRHNVDPESLQRKVNRCPFHPVLGGKCANCVNGVKEMKEHVTIRAPPIERVRKMRGNGTGSFFEYGDDLNESMNEDSLTNMVQLRGLSRNGTQNHPNDSFDANAIMQSSTSSKENRFNSQRFFNIQPRVSAVPSESTTRVNSFSTNQPPASDTLQVDSPVVKHTHSSSLPKQHVNQAISLQRSISANSSTPHPKKNQPALDTSCKCPSNKMNIVVDRVVSLDIATAWECFFTIDSYSIQKRVCEREDLRDIKLSDWTLNDAFELSSMDDFDACIPPFSDASVGMKRKITYTRPLHSVLVKETSCIAAQEIKCKSTESVCVEINSTTPNVPHGEGFTVHQLFKLTKLSRDKTHVMVSAEFIWKRGLWILKSQVEAGGYAGVSKTYELLFESIDEWAAKRERDLESGKQRDHEDVGSFKSSNVDSGFFKTDSGQRRKHALHPHSMHARSLRSHSQLPRREETTSEWMEQVVEWIRPRATIERVAIIVLVLFSVVNMFVLTSVVSSLAKIAERIKSIR